MARTLDLLGTREPAVYGAATLASIEAAGRGRGEEGGHELEAFQSNAEHELIARIHKAGQDGTAFAICNWGAFTHTSVALRRRAAGCEAALYQRHFVEYHARR